MAPLSAPRVGVKGRQGREVDRDDRGWAQTLSEDAWELRPKARDKPQIDARGDQHTSLTTSFKGDDPSLRNEADGFGEACVHNLTVQSALQLKNTFGS